MELYDKAFREGVQSSERALHTGPLLLELALLDWWIESTDGTAEEVIEKHVSMVERYRRADSFDNSCLRLRSNTKVANGTRLTAIARLERPKVHWPRESSSAAQIA